MLFRTAALDRPQAGYVKRWGEFLNNPRTDWVQFCLPFADGTAVKATPYVVNSAHVLMADIFPTRYFAAHKAVKELIKD